MAAASVPFSFSEDEIDKVKANEKAGKDKGNDLKGLIGKRRGKRGAVTKNVNYVYLNFSTLSVDDCRSYVFKLQQLKADLDELDDKIIALAIDKAVYTEEEFDAHLEINELYSDKVNSAIFSLNSRTAASSSGSTVSHDSSNVTKAKLPQVELPTFSGSVEEFEKFIATFEAIINKHGLSGYEKYVYLKKQLTGSPKVLIESLPLNELTYESAKKLLTDAYCDKTTQQYSVIGKLVRLKLDGDGDSFAWISAVRTILDQVRILKVDLDMILQYFIWHSLNDRFKQQFVLITNNKNPTLAEIKANMFEANARYMEQNERIRKRKEPIVSKSSPSVLATNIPGRTSNAFKPCKLCKDGGSVPDHSMSRCPKYSNATDKLRRIQELNGCTRC